MPILAMRIWFIRGDSFMFAVGRMPIRQETDPAEASREAGSFDAWRRQRRPRLLGELPRRLLREEDFIHHLLDTCIHYCHSPATRAA